MLAKPHQRVGATSNAAVGKEFETAARSILAARGMELQPNLKLFIGVGTNKKEHAFDLGCEKQKILVECKSHRWTGGTNVPSAKMTVWNEAMYYFHLAPREYRKIMFVLHDHSTRHGLTLAEYYVKTYSHLIPPGVQFWEFDEVTNRTNVLVAEAPHNGAVDSELP